jgi:hypothetical protein
VVRETQELAQVAVPMFADLVTVDLLDAMMRRRSRGRRDGGSCARAAITGELSMQCSVGEQITFSSATPQARALPIGPRMEPVNLESAAGASGIDHRGWGSAGSASVRQAQAGGSTANEPGPVGRG